MKGWHISAAANRASIAETGLRRDGGGWDAGFIWFFVDRPTAEKMAEGRAWGGFRGGNDVWGIDLSGLDVLPDPHPGWGDERDEVARAVVVNVEPERLSLSPFGSFV